ncbi:MAG: hypothetical protein IPK88_18140 [Saprospiraceae bacterium]|nr:hypothetical protein [Candidatus Defluviibacterium haderslevense]HRI35086.1 hypothetical protein [Saprospiraceae bacterium]
MPTSNFDPNTGTYVTLSEAQSMASNWAGLQSSLNMPISEANPKAYAFGNNKMLGIINQNGCEGIRLYNGYENNKRVIIVVGIDENGDDMTGGYILELSRPCPPNCGSNTVIG